SPGWPAWLPNLESRNPPSAWARGLIRPRSLTRRALRPRFGIQQQSCSAYSVVSVRAETFDQTSNESGPLQLRRELATPRLHLDVRHENRRIGTTRPPSSLVRNTRSRSVSGVAALAPAATPAAMQSAAKNHTEWSIRGDASHDKQRGAESYRPLFVRSRPRGIAYQLSCPSSVASCSP